VDGIFHRVGRIVSGAGAVMLALIRDLLAIVPDDYSTDDRQIHDADYVGDYNHRTGRLDAGNDPYGWYDED
jgi:hypothetical protein